MQDWPVGEFEDRRQDHVDLMAHLRQLESQLASLSRELGDTRVHHEHAIVDIKEDVERFCQWMRADTAKSAWFYTAEPELRHLVESAQWIRTTKKIVVWIVGTLVGAIMAWNAAEAFIRGRM